VQRHGIHNPKHRLRAINLLIRTFTFHLLVSIAAIRVAVAVDFRGDVLQTAERALERPLDELHTSSAEREALTTCYRRGSQAGVFAQVFGRHERELEVVLYQHACDELALLVLLLLLNFLRVLFTLFVFSFAAYWKGGRRELGESADHFGGLVRAEGDA